MYGFSGYGTNPYGSLRQEGKKSVVAILAIVGTRTVTLFTNFVGTVLAMTNFNRTVKAKTNASQDVPLA
jgi:hypothetical protein